MKESGSGSRPPDSRRVIPPPTPDRPQPGHGELVLIVEDEPEFRELVEMWVSRHGWRTAVAADGLEVMRRFEEEEPDLVLLDLNLPGMDGWEVTEWIRQVSVVPVLIVTAMGAKSENALEAVLKDLAIPFRTVGDAKTPRRILEAIHEGYRAGEEIYTK